MHKLDSLPSSLATFFVSGDGSSSLARTTRLYLNDLSCSYNWWCLGACAAPLRQYWYDCLIAGPAVSVSDSTDSRHTWCNSGQQQATTSEQTDGTCHQQGRKGAMYTLDFFCVLIVFLWLWLFCEWVYSQARLSVNPANLTSMSGALQVQEVALKTLVQISCGSDWHRQRIMQVCAQVNKGIFKLWCM